MVWNGVKRKMATLRAEPEPVRLRAAALLTAVTGGILVVAWITVLLPLQLRFSQPASDATQQAAASPLASAAPLFAQPTEPAVAGTRAPSLAPELPVANTATAPSPPISSPSPTPLIESSAPVQVQP